MMTFTNHKELWIDLIRPWPAIQGVHHKRLDSRLRGANAVSTMSLSAHWLHCYDTGQLEDCNTPCKPFALNHNKRGPPGRFYAEAANRACL